MSDRYLKIECCDDCNAQCDDYESDLEDFDTCKLPTLADILAPLRAKLENMIEVRPDGAGFYSGVKYGHKQVLDLLDTFSKGELENGTIQSGG